MSKQDKWALLLGGFLVGWFVKKSRSWVLLLVGFLAGISVKLPWDKLSNELHNGVVIGLGLLIGIPLFVMAIIYSVGE